MAQHPPRPPSVPDALSYRALLCRFRPVAGCYSESPAAFRAFGQSRPEASLPAAIAVQDAGHRRWTCQWQPRRHTGTQTVERPRPIGTGPRRAAKTARLTSPASVHRAPFDFLANPVVRHRCCCAVCERPGGHCLSVPSGCLACLGPSCCGGPIVADPGRTVSTERVPEGARESFCVLCFDTDKYLPRSSFPTLVRHPPPLPYLGRDLVSTTKQSTTQQNTPQ